MAVKYILDKPASKGWQFRQIFPQRDVGWSRLATGIERVLEKTTGVGWLRDGLSWIAPITFELTRAQAEQIVRLTSVVTADYGHAELAPSAKFVEPIPSPEAQAPQRKPQLRVAPESDGPLPRPSAQAPRLSKTEVQHLSIGQFRKRMALLGARQRLKEARWLLEAEVVRQTIQPEEIVDLIWRARQRGVKREAVK